MAVTDPATATRHSLMIKYMWFLLLAAAAAVAACSQGSPSSTRPSVVLLSDPYDSGVPPLGLPDTVRRGVPFQVTFVTVYPSSLCWKPDGENIVILGEQVRITPREVYVLPEGEAGPCDLLQVGPRSTAVTLDLLGTYTIRVVGRVDPYGGSDPRGLDSVSASVVVVP